MGVETFSNKISEQLKRVEIIKNRKYKPADKYSVMQTDYVWLLEKLTQSSKNNICGCQIPILPVAITQNRKTNIIVNR
jgi:hypothetical protein